MNKFEINWKLIDSRLINMLKAIPPDSKIYGIPNGGSILAGYIASRNPSLTLVMNPIEANVFIDDIIDSGKTMKKYTDKFTGIPFFALINKLGKDSDSKDTWYIFPWEREHPKQNSITDAVIRQLQYIGEDVTREGLKDTPKRVVKAWDELFSGYNIKAEDIITTFKDDTCDQMVVLKDIEFYSMCEHHLLPFYGKAHIGYIPNGKIIGISKLARILDMYARRAQIQERIGEQVTNCLEGHLSPKGAACVIEAQHLCMQARGIQKQNSIMTTSSLTGEFHKNEVKNEFLRLIK